MLTAVAYTVNRVLELAPGFYFNCFEHIPCTIGHIKYSFKILFYNIINRLGSDNTLGKTATKSKTYLVKETIFENRFWFFSR